MSTIHIQNLQTTIDALPGRSLLISLLNEEQPVHTVCGGKAGCGCCRVKIISGKKKLSPVNEAEKIRLGEELISNGWRLSCQTYLLRDVSIHLPRADELDVTCSKRK